MKSFLSVICVCVFLRTNSGKKPGIHQVHVENMALYSAAQVQTYHCRVVTIIILQCISTAYTDYMSHSSLWVQLMHASVVHVL